MAIRPPIDWATMLTGSVISRAVKAIRSSMPRMSCRGASTPSLGLARNMPSNPAAVATGFQNEALPEAPGRNRVFNIADHHRRPFAVDFH